MKRYLFLCAMLSAWLLGGCASTALMKQPPVAQVIDAHASAGPLPFADGRVLMSNDDAFAAKLNLVEQAKESVDLAYYIFDDDDSTAALTQALIDAARRGVQVRLLVDYFSEYKDLDRFSWLEQQGGGRIAVRFYNRPTLEIVKDAAFLTLSCADVGVKTPACDSEKQQAVDSHFAADAHQAFTNLQFAGSGVFLSGLYGKNPKLMAYAISRGQDIDAEALASGATAADSQRTEQLKTLGKLFFKARYVGGAEGLAAKLKLAFIRQTFGAQVNPVFDAVNSYLPLSRQNNARAQKDWDYLTEFLHHKFLLVDRRALILGGRNMADAYHMHPNPLADKYIFMDTDVQLPLTARSEALAASFDRLWNLHDMVAPLAEVRRHAPNDLLMNFKVLTAAQAACDKGQDAACVDRYVDRHFVPLEARMQAVAKAQQQHLREYMTKYRPRSDWAPLTIDAGANIFYFENLPFTDGKRNYGARHNHEAEHNKNIQALWRAALQQVCAQPDAAPREVLLHNAYLFLPANLLQDIAAMLDGTRPCPGVTLTVLTNSLATTDLNVVNLLAVWELKALADHVRASGPAGNAATLRYLEYRPIDGASLSLHSKVMVFDRDLFIGSSNADLRSFMMDSNNGVFIRNAPRLVAAYRQRIHQLIDTPGRIADDTARLGRDKDQLSTEMNQLIDQLLARYAGPDRLSAQQVQDLKAQVQATTQKVYDLSRRIMQGDTQAANEFNELFKGI
ncbi:hypothetical protein G3580_18490 [Nitrogeniibacter mangrovi]|uniref:PLD phosphodiesterase domain-containing protein n=1 Tax=Nitrogeniibacter mangrovi TaxID=2016596 RepID=A0A6C1B8Z4_9RHOO|nr:phospholipase D-like domain-containing protein [Nitrogeniibacter mangrovi]QID19429.1 hypothetical protein G3580_18490 [Nitrogeniibacter mangrovi]